MVIFSIKFYTPDRCGEALYDVLSIKQYFHSCSESFPKRQIYVHVRRILPGDLIGQLSGLNAGARLSKWAELTACCRLPEEPSINANGVVSKGILGILRLLT